MEKQRGIKILSIVALIVAVLGLTVAFAVLSEKLDITGTGTVLGNESNSTWKIYFDDLSEPSITGDLIVVTDPKISATGTEIEGFSVNLSGEQGSISYTFDVVNDGKVDAELTKLSIATPSCEGNGDNASSDETNVCEKLSLSLKYSDSEEDGEKDVKEDDTLLAGESKTMILTLEYSDVIEITDDVYITFNGENNSAAVFMQYTQK